MKKQTVPTRTNIQNALRTFTRKKTQQNNWAKDYRSNFKTVVETNDH
jgi:hypothetical protein